MNKYLLILPVIFVAACSEPERIVEIRSKPIERPTLILPETSVYKARPIEWTIITEENAATKFNELTSKGQQPVFFALTAKGYENVSLNLAELLKILQEQRSVIVAYQNYYEKTDRTIRNHNATSQ